MIGTVGRPMQAVLALVLASSTLLGQAGPSDRPKVDETAAQRGRQVYSQQCSNCHGALGRGTGRGPDLIRSTLMMKDRLGDQLGPALKRLAGHTSLLNPAQLVDVSHFLKGQIENTVKNRNPPEIPPNVLTGNREAGRVYFNGAGGCAKCHSAEGDLKGIGKKYMAAVDLQQRFLFPRQTKPVQVRVTPAGGQTVTGDLVRIDDFNVTLRSAGRDDSFPRSANLKVELDDPLGAHHEMLAVYTDHDIHDVVRYLESLK